MQHFMLGGQFGAKCMFKCVCGFLFRSFMFIHV